MRQIFPPDRGLFFPLNQPYEDFAEEQPWMTIKGKKERFRFTSTNCPRQSEIRESKKFVWTPLFLIFSVPEQVENTTSVILITRWPSEL